MDNLYQKTVFSPVGNLILASTESELKIIRFSEDEEKNSEIIPEIILQAEQQLKEYFKGDRFSFNLKLNPEGTEFQKKVWSLVQGVPFGETSTYNNIATKLGDRNYIRAVGMANGKNPIPIIIPCHRVIGSNGKLVGYAGGIEKKKQLLLHELNHLKKGILF